MIYTDKRLWEWDDSRPHTLSAHVWGILLALAYRTLGGIHTLALSLMQLTDSWDLLVEIEKYVVLGHISMNVQFPVGYVDNYSYEFI